MSEPKIHTTSRLTPALRNKLDAKAKELGKDRSWTMETKMREAFGMEPLEEVE